MKKIGIALLVLLYALAASGQIERNQKIQIVLLGTLHFEPSEVDAYKNDKLDVLGKKRQKEIREVVEAIAKWNPNQICIEYPLSAQRKMDSIYQTYLAGRYTLTNDEIDQLALRTAKKMQLARLSCVNYYGLFDMDTVMTFAQQNDQVHITKEIAAWGETFMIDINQKLKEETIGDFLLYINSESALQRNASFYTKYLARIGKEENYIGTDLIADWYNTNLHIYTNVLRQIQPEDKKVLVIFGQGHIPILRHLFRSNPDFELVEVKKLF